MYLSLQVKGHHGETQVQQKVLLLKALQGPAHAERHHVGPPDEEQGAEDVECAQADRAHEANLRQQAEKENVYVR